MGKLGEFQPRPVGYPPYAVVDEKSEIICLITPAPGVDLDDYIGKKVGINGVFAIYQKSNEPDKRLIIAHSVVEVR